MVNTNGKAKGTKIMLVMWIAVSFGLSLLTGCSDEFLDPTQVGRFRQVPSVNIILDSLGVAEETPSQWQIAEEPKPVDTVVYSSDYIFGPGDLIRVSIHELFQEGLSVIAEYSVTETGKISIPEVGTVEVTGLTESMLEEELKQILSPGLLKNPRVTAVLINSQKRVYSILGNGVPSPGRFQIPRYDFRLNDALATSQVATQFNTSYIYVTRIVTGQEPVAQAGYGLDGGYDLGDDSKIDNQNDIHQQHRDQMLEIVAPRAKKVNINDWHIVTTSEMSENIDDDLADIALPEGFEPTDSSEQNASAEKNEIAANETRESITQPIAEVEQGDIEWIFQDGKWVPIQSTQDRQQSMTKMAKNDSKSNNSSKQLQQQLPDDYTWEQVGSAGQQTRVIKIPTDKLAGGDPRYNIVIRPGDSVHVPVDIIGEFYIIGNANYQGTIQLTGRPMTLKMAIAAAGGLGPLAWPKKCEVTRRIGKNREETVMVDLRKIAKGEQPDFFIKPNDLINVGTHPTSRWRSVLRNAFRATYGFGFLYDRNFADRDFGTSRPFSMF